MTIRIAATPTPRPRPMVHVVRIVPVNPAHRLLTRTSAASATRPVVAHVKRVVVHRAVFAMHYGSKPEWDVAGPGAGHRSGPTAGNGSVGTTPGTGGNAVAAGSEPCGFVTFSDPHGSQYDPRTHGFHVDIRMSVHFADGTSQSLILDYPWYYASEAENPWSDQNLKDPGFPTRFQPPPAAKTAAEPELVRYVMAHSTSDGMTLLHDCPGSSDATAPRPDRSLRS